MQQKIAFDINHPADVHTFKNLIKLLKRDGHQILVTVRHSQCSTELLVENKIEFLIRPSGHGLIDRFRKVPEILHLLKRQYQQFKPDLLIGGPGNLYVAQLGKFLNIPAFILDDTEHTKIQNILTFPFAKKIWTPECYYLNLGSKQVRFPGSKELAYLHPNHYQFNRENFKGHLMRQLEAEGKEWLKRELIRQTKPVILLRIVAWDASHDQFRRRLIDISRIFRALKQLGILIVSTGGKCVAEYAEHYIQLSAAYMHDLISFSDIVISEGATTAAEAAVLGKPTIYFNIFRLGYIDEYDKKFGLIKQVRTNDQVIHLTRKFINDPVILNEFAEKRKRILQEKQDVTLWMYNYLNKRVFFNKSGEKKRSDVCQIAKVDPNHVRIGGIENYVAQISTLLRQRKYQVHLIGVEELPQNGYLSQPDWVRKKAAQVHHFDHDRFTSILKNYRPEFITNFRFLTHLYLKGSSCPIAANSLLHFHRPDYVLPFTRLSNPKICTIHGNPRQLIKLTKNRLMAATYFLLEKMLIPAFNKLIFVSKTAFAEYSERFPNLREKMTVIPVGIPDHFCRQSDRKIMDWRKKQNVRPEDKILLFVGRLDKEKQVTKIINLFHQAQTKYGELSNVFFFILGTGEEGVKIEEQIKSLGNMRIRLLNYVPNNKLPVIYSSADATILFSLNEGTPSVALESLACGTPVLANYAGDLPLIIRSGLNGYLCDDVTFERSLIQVLKESKNMRHHCMKSIQSNRIDAVTERLIAIYDEVWVRVQSSRF
jgi:predicted glycosyltransferase/glycosyltransferase involved in cell wall biosynthesis